MRAKWRDLRDSLGISPEGIYQILDIKVKNRKTLVTRMSMKIFQLRDEYCA
jgi:hypothetical protein